LKTQTSELSGVALDWAVATAKDLAVVIPCGDKRVAVWSGLNDPEDFHPSTDWAQGGPIIEREKLSFREERPGLHFGYIWDGAVHRLYASGPTPLIAAMRCYVASKLGDEVDVPEELLK